MEIKYLGHSSFQIKTKTARIITDPFDSTMVGLKYPKSEADIVTVSHAHRDHDAAEQIGGSPLIVNWPGEFEKNDVRIFGFQSFHDKQKGVERGENVLYKFEVEGVSILHCGDLGLIPSDDFIDSIGEVDVLFVPVGGFYTIDADEAIKLIKQIEPSVVIPMHYNHAQLNQESFSNLLPVEDFLKKMGIETHEPIDKLTITAETLVPEELKVVVMQISTS